MRLPEPERREAGLVRAHIGRFSYVELFWQGGRTEVFYAHQHPKLIFAIKVLGEALEEIESLTGNRRTVR